MQKPRVKKFWNMNVLEKIAIGDSIITIESNPKRHVRVSIESSETVKVITASNEEKVILDASVAA